MGAGLPIAQSIIEAHNGRIRADNEPALGGARFVFQLPVSSPSIGEVRGVAMASAIVARP
jgi:signal transduction histidine kinase